MSQPADFTVPQVADQPVSPTLMASRMDASLAACLSSHSGVSRPSYAVAGTIWHDTDLVLNSPLLFWDGTDDRKILTEDASGDVEITNALTVAASDITVTAGNLVITTPTTPANASDTGTVGTITWDADYLYICIATDTWKRVAIATW